MSQEDVETARRAFAAFASGGWEACMGTYWDPDIVWNMTPTGIPGLGTYRGFDELRTFFEDWFSTFPFEEWEQDLEDVIDCGEQVVALTRQRDFIPGTPVIKGPVVYAVRRLPGFVRLADQSFGRASQGVLAAVRTSSSSKGRGGRSRRAGCSATIHFERRRTRSRPSGSRRRFPEKPPLRTAPGPPSRKPRSVVLPHAVWRPRQVFG